MLSGMPNQPFAWCRRMNVAPTARDRRIAALAPASPTECGARAIAPGGRHLDDVAEIVFGARVGGVGLGRRAVGVVGKNHIDLFRDRAGLDILGPVHFGGADEIGRRGAYGSATSACLLQAEFAVSRGPCRAPAAAGRPFRRRCNVATDSAPLSRMSLLAARLARSTCAAVTKR